MNTPTFQLHPDTHIAHVELQVADLGRMTAFYSGLMGFQIIDEADGVARLSPNGQLPALLTLTEHKGARLQPQERSGLYHTAFRFTDRKTLATTFLRVVSASWPLQGASDHLVSEAIYFADPENNGIEIYRDRPREQWPRMDGTGELQMANAPLDLHKLLDEADHAAAQAGVIDAGTDIGHMHLQVSNTATAATFYHDLLGMDIIFNWPGALFLSAGGYHHHLGANTWHSQNAPRREDDMTGLRSYAYRVPDEAGWLALLQRVQSSQQVPQATERDGQPGFWLPDQDGNRVEILGPDTSVVRAAVQTLVAIAASGAPAAA
ncbi:MAG: VOC family protein [Anaerolineales bacterium]|nr:VOC family protein [Anaerolineales bacterium]